MKWPFVRRSKHEEVRLERNDNYLKSLELECENKLLTEEINRLNQELASELNSHRAIKKEFAEAKKYYEHSLKHEQEDNENLEKELEETKDALKIAQEDLRIYKGLVKSNKESIKYYLEKAINYL